MPKFNMTFDQLKTIIFKFRQKVQNYRDLMLASRDDVIPEIIRNGQQIMQMRSELNEEYGRIEKYIEKFGNNPRMSDGVNPVIYPVYSNAFSNDVLIRVGASTDAVLQDLDYIIGKLNGMSEHEFNEVIQPPKKENVPAMPSINYWHKTNPAWLLWKLMKWIWKHKLISVIITLLSVLAIDYSLAWRNAIWIKDFFLKIF